MEEQKKPAGFDEFMKDLTGDASVPAGSPQGQKMNSSQENKPQFPSTPPQAPLPQTVMPPKPSVPQSPTPPPPPPRPPSPSSSGTQAPPPPSPSRPGLSQEYQSSLRTMADDISKIKSGQKLSGVEMPKRTTQQIDPAKKMTYNPEAGKLPGSGQPTSGAIKSEREVGGTVRSPEISQSKYTPGTGLVNAKGQVVAHERPLTGNEPLKPGFLSGLRFNISKKLVLMVIIGLAVIVGGYFGMGIINKEPEIIIQTFTPRPSKTPVPITNLSSIFGTISQSEFKTQNLTEEILQQKVKEQVVSPGQFLKFPILVGTSSKSLGFKSLLETLAKGYPEDIIGSLGDDSIVLIYGQREVFDSVTGEKISSTNLNRMAIIAEIKDLSKLSSTLGIWASKIHQDLSPVLGVKFAGQVVLSEHVYKDIVIRFANSKFPDNSIDYAVVPAQNQKNYLVITNSRESMFAAIDRLRAK